MADCYNCRYRGTVPGDAHSCCCYPGNAYGLFDFFSENNKRNMKKLNIKINRYGFSQGWAFWPNNFDPVWIENCDGFDSKKEKKHG